MKELFKAINRELVDNKLRHVQVLFCIKNGQRYMKFVSVDTPRYKDRVKAICDRYHERLSLAEETKTTLWYLI